MTLLKNKQTSCVLPAKGLCVFISSWKIGPQGLRKDLAAHATLPGDRRPHTQLLSIRFLGIPQGEDWPKQYPWVEQQTGGNVSTSPRSVHKSIIYV